MSIKLNAASRIPQLESHLDASSQGQPRRRLVSFGFLRWRICKSPLFDDPFHLHVYLALKSVGFRETPWQYIYDGQLAGLVKPEKNDVHIRFYPDRLFAEVEISRAFVSHFYGPQFNAREVILGLLRTKLSHVEHDRVRDLLHSKALRFDEICLPVWTERTVTSCYAPFQRIETLKPKSFVDTIRRRFVGFGWRGLGLMLIILLAAALASATPAYVLLLVSIAAMCIVHMIAPPMPDEK